MVLPMIATIAITILNLNRIAISTYITIYIIYHNIYHISPYITFSGYMNPSFPFTCHVIRFTHRVQYLTNSFWPIYQDTSSFYFAEKFDQIVHNHCNLLFGGHRLQKLKASADILQSIFKLSKDCPAAFCCRKKQHSNKLIEFLSMRT